MRSSAFDDEEEEPSAPDRELTLSTGTLLGLFFALVLVCGLCFGVGYTLGSHSGGSASARSSEKAPDPTLLSKSAAKPSPEADPAPTAAAGLEAQAASNRNGVPAASTPAAPMADNLTAATEAPAPTATTGPAAMQQAVSLTAGAAGAGAQGMRVHPALEQSATQPAPAVAAKAVEAALPAVNPAARSAEAAEIMVQVAAVSDPVDAQVLLDALRKRGFAVKLTRGTTDSLTHVQVGPFASRVDALATRQRLLHDGYNAIVK